MDYYAQVLAHKGSMSKVRIALYLKWYKRRLELEKNYPNPGDKLEDWVDQFGHSYNSTLNPIHDFVLSRVVKLNVESVLDIGSGPGVVSKYIYARYAEMQKSLSLHCLENSKVRVQLMRENFSASSKVILPFIDVEANIMHSDGSNIPLKDRSVNLAFTCTVLQHLPFPYSINVVKEMARVSGKYVLHVEGFHPEGVIRTGKSRVFNFFNRKEMLLPSLPYLYDMLGFDTVEFSTGKFPHQEEYRYFIYLGIRREELNNGNIA